MRVRARRIVGSDVREIGQIDPTSCGAARKTKKQTDGWVVRGMDRWTVCDKANMVKC